MFAWVRRGKAIMHTYIRLVALSTEEPQDTVFELNSLSSVAVMSDMYAWNDLCGSREIGVKSQAMCTAAGFFPLLPRMGALVLVTDGGATCGEWTRNGRPSLKNWRAPTQLEMQSSEDHTTWQRSILMGIGLQ